MMMVCTGCEVHEEEAAIFAHVQRRVAIPQNAEPVFPRDMRYTVQRYDTYASLARRCHVHVDQILSLNAHRRMQKGDLLEPGETIMVPFPSCTTLHE